MTVTRPSIVAGIVLGVIAALSAAPPTMAQTPSRPSGVRPTTMSWAQLTPILARDASVLTAPPSATPTSNVPDGPLLGNGDMNVAVGGSASAQTAYIDAGDYWSDALPRTIGGLTISVPGLDSGSHAASYNQVQDIEHGAVESRFRNGTASVTEQMWVAATENTLVTSMTNTGSTAQPVTVTTYTGSSEAEPATSGVLNGAAGPTLWATRTTNSTQWLANAALASRVLGATGVQSASGVASSTHIASAAGSFTLAPGQTVEVATVLRSSGGDVSGSPEPAPASVAAELAAAQTRDAQLTANGTSTDSVLDNAPLRQQELAWWQNFWLSGATVDLGGGDVERYWYTSLYALACANRAGDAAPGMQMFQTNDNPRWHGWWTTDYNMQMPYQGVYSANRVSLAEPYNQAVMDYLGTGEAMATAAGYQGVLVPNDIGPGGVTGLADLLGMKGNAAWLGTNFAAQWNYTRNASWASSTGYPYLSQVANFWDSYLIKNAQGQYTITNSAQNELSQYNQNPIGDLAWLRYIYPALLDMAKTLGVGQSHWTQWQDISTHLAGYPTFTYNGHTDFKATQDAPGFYGNDANPVNAVFPGNDIGLGSASDLVQTARNTIYDLGESGMGDGGSGTIWSQGNSFAWVYPAAARVGLPDTYSRLQAFLGGRYASVGQPGLRANSTVDQWGGGAETFGGTETVDSMLLDESSGVLRLFQDWPAALPASFTDMLAVGGFEVSATQRDGVVQPVAITSTQGGTATMVSPWRSGSLTVLDQTTGSPVPVNTSVTGEVSFLTRAGDTYQVSGQGTASTTPVDLAPAATVTTSTDLNTDDWRASYLNDGQSDSEPGGLGWSSASPDLAASAAASASSSLESPPAWGVQNVVSGAGSGWTTMDNLTAAHSDWVQEDLGKTATVNQVTLVPRQDPPNTGYGFPNDFTIAVSNDGTSWTTVANESNYPMPNSGADQVFTFPAVQARYLRVTGSARSNPQDSGYYRMQFKQMLVYGPTAAGTAPWAQLTFPAATDFTAVTLYPRDDAGHVGQDFPASVTISVSDNGSTWREVATGAVTNPNTGSALTIAFAAQHTRYVRISGTTLTDDPVTGQPTMELAEISVHQ